MQVAGRFLDPSLIDTLNQYAQTQLTKGEPIISLTISIIVLIFGATTVINQFKITLNRIWNVEEVKIHSVSFYLYSRLKSFSIMIIMLALLISSVLLEGILSFLTGFFGQIIPNLDLYLWLSRLLTIAFSVLSFAILFKYLPDVRASWRDIFVGAFITAGLFIAGKYAIGVYFSAFDIATAFKAAGSLIVFLVWIYYSSAIILIGAVFTQVYTRQFGGPIEPYRYVSFSNRSKKAD
jgi:membrane protein